MRPDERDLAYLWDMLDVARTAKRLIVGLDFAAFVADERTSLAIERLLENVGEAARHVSSRLQDGHPEIPWQGIIGMRNVLAHQYGVVDQRKVWEAAKEGARSRRMHLSPPRQRRPRDLVQPDQTAETVVWLGGIEGKLTC